jgi:hypothetical protein
MKTPVCLDPDLVQEAKRLTLEHKTDEVMKLLYGK